LTKLVPNLLGSPNPSSYLVKPFIATDLYIAVELAIDKIENASQIIVKERDKNIIVPGEDILFAKKEDQYLSLHLTNSTKLIRSSIKEFLE
jgi:DNA-binding LytR/AlgR family response regulator